MLNDRMKLSILTAIILGIFCVLGSGIRVGFKQSAFFLIALFYNRLLMGIVFGLLQEAKGINLIIRGALMGLFISLAFYLSTGFADPISFFAGIVYGIIIDLVASKYNHKIKNLTWL
ncbi:MAG: hypothetical protein ACOC5A_03425 [Halanaerobiales bacterium]